jgi:hypothetical protein
MSDAVVNTARPFCMCTHLSIRISQLFLNQLEACKRYTKLLAIQHSIRVNLLVLYCVCTHIIEHTGLVCIHVHVLDKTLPHQEHPMQCHSEHWSNNQMDPGQESQSDKPVCAML